VYVHVPPPLELFLFSLLPQNLLFQSEMPQNEGQFNICPKRRYIFWRIEYTCFYDLRLDGNFFEANQISLRIGLSTALQKLTLDNTHIFKYFA
jgi:hypothetical protein